MKIKFHNPIVEHFEKGILLIFKKDLVFFLIQIEHQQGVFKIFDFSVLTRDEDYRIYISLLNFTISIGIRYT